MAKNTPDDTQTVRRLPAFPDGAAAALNPEALPPGARSMMGVGICTVQPSGQARAGDATGQRGGEK
jgi:hypothetical protein